jgi:manganese-dependent inorganic pyrophosphatase
MQDSTQNKRKIMVIGHRNPDTDSICSAIAYANLKNQISEPCYEPCRAGELNQETTFVLEKFHMPVPRRCLDVRAQVQDIDIREIDGVDGRMTMRHAWETMRDQDITSLPITTPENELAGLITLQDIAMANMDSLDVHGLSKAHTTISNLLETLQGDLIVGDPNTCLDRGKIVVGAGSPDVLETMVEEGDIVLLANRYETQLCAIEMNASCLVVCLAPAIAKTIVKLAKEHNCTIISTPFDTYKTSCLINQSMPIQHYMQKELRTFQLTTPVEEVKKVMGQVRYNYFPVLDKDSHYRGVISKRNLLNLQRKQLILVDHNEKTQCVDGLDEADVLEIIDHHRIGNLETNGPVYFRNQPVGCTATIIYQMYQENHVVIEPDMAGILCCAILSDTLAFRSPTCTKIDEAAAQDLAQIAHVNLEAMATEMFEAGENITNKTAEEIFLQDYKVFVHDDIHFGVGQGSYISEANRKKVKEILIPHLQTVLERENVNMVFYMLTSVLDQSSEIIYAGKGAEELLQNAFGVLPAQDCFILPGVVSRKKQFIPSIIRTLQQEN